MPAHEGCAEHCDFEGYACLGAASAAPSLTGHDGALSGLLPDKLLEPEQEDRAQADQRELGTK